MTIRSARAQIEVDPLFAFAATAQQHYAAAPAACSQNAAAAASDGGEELGKRRTGLARVAEAMPAWQAAGAAQRTNECKSLCSRAGLGFVPIS